MEKKTFTMEKPGNPRTDFALGFTFSSADPQSLTLEGKDSANPIRVTLDRVDEKQFALLDQTIHWINEDTGN